MPKTIMITFEDEDDFHRFMEYKKTADETGHTVTGLTNGLMSTAMRGARITEQPASKFKVGQTVEVTNPNGVRLGKKKIAGTTNDGTQYYLEPSGPSDAFWYAWHEKYLKAA